jgi:hypothetical protein
MGLFDEKTPEVENVEHAVSFKRMDNEHYTSCRKLIIRARATITLNQAHLIPERKDITLVENFQ